MNKWMPISLLLALGLLASCQQQKQTKDDAAAADKAKKAPPPLYLGTVHQVYPEQGFALLRLIGPVPEKGCTLITHPANGSNDRIGNLCVSSTQAARKGMIAADIRSGTVVQGDLIFRYRDIAEPAGKEQEMIEEETPSSAADNRKDDTIVENSANRDLLPESSSPALPNQADNAGGSSPAEAEIPDVKPAPAAKPTPQETPSYLNEIPDNINQWDNM